MTASTILQFGGDDSYLKSPDSQSLNHDGTFTLEAWVKYPEDTQDCFILKKTDGVNFQYSMQIKNQDQTKKLYVYYGENGESISEDIPDTQDVWHHFAASVAFSAADSTSVAKIYIDGKLVQSSHENPAAGKTLSYAAADLFIGQALSGAVAEVKIWNFARPKEEIMADMYNPLTGREPGLIAYWPLNGSAKEAVADTDSILYQCQWTENESPIILETDNCLNLKWPGHYGKIEEMQDFPVERFTITFWIKTFNTDPNCRILSYTDLQGQYTEALSILNASNITPVICDQTLENGTGISVADGRWHHISIIWHSLTGTLTIFKDGAKETFTTTFAKGASIPATGAFALGINASAASQGYNDQAPFEGKLCDFRIWNTVRTQYEVISDMLFRLEGDEAGLYAYWQMKNTEGNTVSDLSSAKQDITLIGSGLWEESGLFLKKARIDQLKELRDQFETASLERDTAIAERDQALEEIETLTLERDQLKVERDQLQFQCDELTVERDALILERDQLLARVEELEDMIANVEDNQQAIEIKELVKTINSQIASARTDIMADPDHLYYLKNVEVNLKTVPASDGSALLFPTSLQLKNLEPEHLSDVSLNFFPVQATAPESVMLTAPDLIGYTESLAKQILADADLTPKIGYQSVTEEDGQPVKTGRVVNQYPKAGEQIAPASVVMIFIGKES